MNNSNNLFKLFQNNYFNRMNELINISFEKIGNNVLEEELVDILSNINSKNVGLEFFMEMGRKFNDMEKFLLVKIVNQHILYNFDVVLERRNNKLSYYEIYKKSENKQ